MNNENHIDQALQTPPAEQVHQGALMQRSHIEKEFSITWNEGNKVITMSPFEVADEAIAVQQKGEAFNRELENFAGHFFMLAEKAKSPAEFAALCGYIETERKWGKAPKGTPKAERLIYEGAPKIWTVYKSTILRAWQDFAIKPGATLKLAKRENGQESVTEVKVDGINQLKEYASIERARKAAEGAKYQAPTSGVIVLATGEQKLVPTANTTAQQVRENLAKAPTIEPDFAALMGGLANFYAGLAEVDPIRERFTAELRELLTKYQGELAERVAAEKEVQG